MGAKHLFSGDTPSYYCPPLIYDQCNTVEYEFKYTCVDVTSELGKMNYCQVLNLAKSSHGYSPSH